MEGSEDEEEIEAADEVQEGATDDKAWENYFPLLTSAEESEECPRIACNLALFPTPVHVVYLGWTLRHMTLHCWAVQHTVVLL
jgi:hypothetical protein